MESQTAYRRAASGGRQRTADRRAATALLGMLALATALFPTAGAEAQAVRGPTLALAGGGSVPLGHQNVLGGNDDGFTGPHDIGFEINFFGTTHTQLFVNNNGNVTFGSGLSTFTPFGLTGATGTQIIAPFFADVDTRALANRSFVNAQSQPVARPPAVGLTSFASYTAASDFGQLFGGRSVFSVTWSDVGYFSGGVDKTNTFQLNLVERTDAGAGNFDIEFNYDKVQWETGGASGGTFGLGGSSARAGYSAGSGVAGTFVELFGSGVNGALLDVANDGLTDNSFGSSLLGRYVFQVRNSASGVPGETQLAPVLPSTIIPGDPALGTGPTFVFRGARNGGWYDPPDTYGFEYNAVNGSFFTAVGLPTGFSPFDVCWGASFGTCALGQLGGTQVSFGGDQSAFRITGINPLVDSSNPNGFPTQMFFNGATGDFNMTALLAPQNNNPGTTVPEPGTWALVGAGLLGLVVFRRRRNGFVA